MVKYFNLSKIKKNLNINTYLHQHVMISFKKPKQIFIMSENEMFLIAQNLKLEIEIKTKKKQMLV